MNNMETYLDFLYGTLGILSGLLIFFVFAALCFVIISLFSKKSPSSLSKMSKAPKKKELQPVSNNEKQS